MELDQLKTLINQRLETDHSRIRQEDIVIILRKKTDSVIGKLKRSLIIEIILGILFVLTMTYVCFTTSHWSLKVYFGVFSALMILFIFLLTYLLKRIHQLGYNQLSVKANLKNIVRILEEFIKRYFQFTMVLLPICFTFAFIISAADPVHIPEIDKVADQLFSNPWQVYIFFAIYFIALAIGIYYFTRWYLKKMYGNYLKELQSCINELSSQ